MIAIIDNYDSFTYNLYQYLEESGISCKVFRNDQITIEELIKLNPSGIVISPGPGTPDSAGISLEIVKQLHDKFPILGICLGHQTIGQAFGGKVIRNKKIMHGKVSKIYHKEKNIYQGLSNPFQGVRYHSLVVEKESLPDCLEVTCETDDKTIMGIKHKKYPVEGIQFHPESVLTYEGKNLLLNFSKMYFKGAN